MPLLTKLGCNQAACHGAAGGQAGFQLSLFGYDLQKDHEALLAGDPDPRANWRDPEASLILRKPSGLEDHEGGVLFDPQSFEYQILLAWVQDRARGIRLGTDWHEITRLDVQPPAIRGRPSETPLSLRLQAHWNNGAHEDVTPFCRFESKDNSIASVGEDGEITLHQPGMTHLLIYYDRAIQPVEVIVPFVESADHPQPTPPGTGSIDTAINRQLAQLGLRPAALCSDTEFLRRVSLDLTGRLPRPAEVVAFTGDTITDKRIRKIDELLAGDAYANYWAAWLCELFGFNEAVMPDGAFHKEETQLCYQWVRHRVQDDIGYDRIVSDLIRSLNRRDGQSFDDYTNEMNSFLRPGGATAFAEQERLPFFWGRKHIRKASDKALTFSHTFMGVKLQCAECHKHPFDRWTKEDFEGLEAFFEQMKFGTLERDKAKRAKMRDALRNDKGKLNDEIIRQAFHTGKTVPFPEAFFDANGDVAGQQVDRLNVLSDWLQDRDHPYLAIAIVNRVWEHYFGTGIVNTPDDLSVGNPPSNRELLDRLVLGFINSGYRLRWLHREIVTSHAYQRSATLEDAVAEHRRQFAQAQYRPLTAESLYDAVLLATADDPDQIPADRWMVGSQSLMRSSNRHRILLARMGQPPGKEVCARVRTNDPTLQRTLEVYNGPTFRDLINRPDGWISGLQKTATSSTKFDNELHEYINSAYLRTLSRLPSNEELALCETYCRESESLPDGVRDVLWALINSREFLLNH